MTEEQKTILAGMKRAGMTNSQIAKRLGVTERAVKRNASAIKASKSLTHKAGGIARKYLAQHESLDDLSIA